MGDLGVGLKALAFVLVTGVLTAAVGVALAGTGPGDTRSYGAAFTDVSGLQEGARVRAAGVSVGTVDDVELRPGTVLVTFSVSREVPVTRSTRATVRYKNLIGDRYLELGAGPASGAGAAPLAPGGVIPTSQTRPALDLTELFNGFRPLFEALSPDQINRLTSSVIAVFQGQQATVNSLLASIASLTSTLADRDRVIGRVVENLNTVLGTLDRRKGQFSELVDNLQRLISGLASDRLTIGRSLERINTLAGTTADLLTVLRPEFTATVNQTGRVAAALNTELGTVEGYLDELPPALRLVGRAGSYGSFFNFYLCGVAVKLTGPGGGAVDSPALASGVPRCAAPPDPAGGGS